ncbi:SlyX family protein [Roseovarius salis]|uniref:SlyX family protein n=1 Tax=Roseovarius salis TaxID=3376063 RepID=UPI0037CB2489
MTNALEEKLAHLCRAVDELSEIVARQETEIGVLKRRIDLLLQREAERETAEGGTAAFGDARPPHW